MKMINSIAEKRSLEFKNVPNEKSDLETIWCNLYTQCQEANDKIASKRIAVGKEKEKLRNIVHLVKVFHEFVIDKSRCNSTSAVPKTDAIICEDADIGSWNCQEEVGKFDNVRIQQNDVKHMCVVSADGEPLSIEKDGSIQKHTLHYKEQHTLHYIEQTLHYKEASFHVKLQKHLMNISRGIPVYDTNVHVSRNSEIFESYADKFSLTDEQRNQLFRIWLPVKFSRRLAVKQSFNDKETWLHDNDVDRLKELIWSTRSDSMPTYEILKELKIGQNECTFAFMSTFERTYKAVIDKVTSQSMVKTFVNKFKFLDSVALMISSDKNSLFEAAKLLDIARMHQRKDVKHLHIGSAVRKGLKDSVKTHKINLPSRSNVSYFARKKFSNDKIYAERRKLHVVSKPYNMILSQNSQCQPSQVMERVIPIKDNVPRVHNNSSEVSTILETKVLDIQKQKESKSDILSIIENKLREVQPSEFIHESSESVFPKKGSVMTIFRDIIDREIIRRVLGIG